MRARRSLIAGALALLCSTALAQVPGLGVNAGVVSGGAVFSTWNPNDAASGFTFSNSNNTASIASLGRMVRGTRARASGKYYFEITLNVNVAYSRFGVATSAAGLGYAVGEVVGGTSIDTNGGSYGDGNLYHGFSKPCGFSIPAIAAGDVVGVAADMTANVIYFYKNGSQLCTGGTIPLAAGAYYPAASSSSTSGTGSTGARTFTLNTGKTAFSYPPPSGFSAWQ